MAAKIPTLGHEDEAALCVPAWADCGHPGVFTFVGRNRLSRTASADCNFISRIDNLRDNSKPVSCFEEHSFNIWQFDVDRRVVKRPVVYWTSDSGFEDRSSGCGLIWHQIGWDTTGLHIRKLRDGAVDRKKCDVRRTAPSPDFPPVAVPKCVAKMHELDIFCLDQERDLRITQAINRRQRSHGEWPNRNRFIESRPHDGKPIARDFGALTGSQKTFASGRSFRRRASGS
jgi:hypothetical protein